MKKKIVTGLVMLSLLSVMLCGGCGDESSNVARKIPSTTSSSGPSTTTSTAKETETKQESNVIRSSSTGGSWSVFLYMCGSDLESEDGLASYNIAEILCAPESENVDVVIETGGSYQWYTDEFDIDMDVDANAIERWHENNGTMELVYEDASSSMGSANTLGSFLQWGVQNYPADKYMVVIWDHGGGAGDGVAYDELYNDDCLNLTELANGLAMAGTNFEVVGFDACLMSNIETAAKICPYANYMVASEETEPGTGWDYTSWLTYLVSNPTVDGKTLGVQICNSFYEKCKAEDEEEIATLAVTDLSKIPALVTAFDAMAAELKGFTDDVTIMKPIKQAMNRAENYGGNNEDEGYTNMVDLGDLTLCAEGVLSDTGEKVLDCIIDAVPYHIAGSARTKGNGLSVYIPLVVDYESLNLYAAYSAISAEYVRFLEGMTGWNASSGTVITSGDEETYLDSVEEAETLDEDDYSVYYTMYVDDDGYITLELENGSDIIEDAVCDVYYYDEDYNEAVYLGSDYTVDISDDWTVYKDGFDNYWVYIEGNLCELNAVDYNDDYFIYSVPAYVNDEETYLRLVYDMDDEEFKVIGLWDGMDEDAGYANRTSNGLKNGDVVELIYQVVNLDTEEVEIYVSDAFTVNGEIEVTEEDMGDGIYLYGFVLYDIFGKSYESDMAVIEVEDGEIYAETE